METSARSRVALAERSNGYRTFNPDGVELDCLAQPKPEQDVEMTLEEAISIIGFGRHQLKLTAILGLCWTIDSMEVWMVVLLGTVLKCPWQLSTVQQTLLSTVIFLGYAIGSVLLGRLADKYGRKPIIIFGTVWVAFYGLLSAISPNYIWMIILRTLVGIGVGGTPIASAYYTEAVPAKVRGAATELSQGFFALGSCLQIVSAILLLRPLGWRVWVAFTSLPSLIFIAVAPFLPESPRYLMANDRIPEAEAILRKMAASNGVTLPDKRLARGPAPREASEALKDFFKPELRRTTIPLIFMWLSFGFYYYGMGILSTSLLEQHNDCAVGNSSDSGKDDGMCQLSCRSLNRQDFIALLITSSSEITALPFTAILIETIGRRPTIYIGSCLMAILCFIIIFCPGRMGLIVILFILRGLSSGVGQINYVYTPEVYPTDIRSFATGCGCAIARTGTMFTPFIGQLLLKHSIVLGVLVYVGFFIISAVCGFILPIETKRRAMPL